MSTTVGQCQRCRVRWTLLFSPLRCPHCGEPVRPELKDAAWLLGLDLGQAQDYTALAGLERVARVDMPGDRQTSLYRLRLLKRWPLKTAYPAIVDDIRRLVALPPLRDCRLMADQTGVGQAVVDMLRRPYAAAGATVEQRMPVVLRPVLITSGHQTTFADGSWHVPKKELVSVLQTLLQGGRLEWDRGRLPYGKMLAKELGTFRVKITANAHESFEAWRERDHDDLVLAVALAAWAGERYGGLARPQGLARPESDPYRSFKEGPAARAAARRGLFGLTGRE